jgi:hypothetical protein
VRAKNRLESGEAWRLESFQKSRQIDFLAEMKYPGFTVFNFRDPCEGRALASWPYSFPAFWPFGVFVVEKDVNSTRR